jgi:hypothetical protein
MTCRPARLAAFFGVILPVIGVVLYLGIGNWGDHAETVTERVDANNAVRSGPVKWHPGHYLLVGWDAPEEQVRHLLERLPRFRGVSRFYAWRDLEPQRDRYDFRQVHRHLAEMERLGKRLALHVEVQAYHEGRNYVPDYVKGAEFGGGIYVSFKGAVNPVLWNDAVAERIAKLYRALGSELDLHPLVEVVTTMETSAQVVHAPHPKGIEPYTEAKLLASLKTMLRALEGSFPNTVAIQFANYPVDLLKPLTDEMRGRGIGLGGPDIFVGDSGLRNGVYRYYQRLAGIIPLGTGVQWDNYRMRHFDGPVDEPSIEELFRFGRDQLKDNYLFWEIRTEPKDYFAELVKAATRFPADPSGGLNAACPVAFARCMTD